MNHSPFSVVALVALTIGCSACDKFKPALPEVEKVPSPATPASPADKERTTFTQNAQKDLDELRTLIAGLKAAFSTSLDQLKYAIEKVRKSAE